MKSILIQFIQLLFLSASNQLHVLNKIWKNKISKD